MAVLYQPLSEEDWEFLHAIARSLYLNGMCYFFAIACHRALSWPIVGLSAGDGAIQHAFLKCPDGRYFDVRGKLTVEQVPHDIAGLPKDFTWATIGEEMLLQKIASKFSQEISDFTLTRALWMGQALWPELPWQTGPLCKYRAFLEELSVLCTKHGVWIFAPIITCLPVLIAAEGDEDFVLTPSATGGNYLFNRKLQSER